MAPTRRVGAISTAIISPQSGATMRPMNLDIRVLGRTAQPVEVELLRPLTEVDVALLAVEGRPTGQPPLLKQIRDGHHALARCLATGMSHEEASYVTGYSISRISILLKDPAFMQLIEFNRQNADLAHADLQGRMATLSLGFAAELQERLEDAPQSMSHGFVLEALKTLADRTGHAPVTKSVSVNVDISERLAKARERARAVREAVDVVSEEPAA